MKFLVVWFLAGVLEMPFVGGEEPRWRAGHSYPRPLPQEIMVDAVNYIGLVLLHAHNQNNENNIALSPYGATSVLVALGEGVQGTALNEILRATLLPLDVSVTRVGLRDIHRHLKSYFIPQEGFLAGLTFSHENVTLKPSYEDILRFYGYDIDSFNNALYPDPYSSTTNVDSDSTTESLSSVSYVANISSSTAQITETTPATLVVPSTIDNRDDINISESTTARTTRTETGLTERITVPISQVTNTESGTVQSTLGNDAIPESTSITAVVTPASSATNATTTVPVTTTTTTVPDTTTTTTITVPVITTSTSTAPITLTISVPATSITAPTTTATSAPATSTTEPVTTTISVPATSTTAPTTTTTSAPATSTTAPTTTTTSAPATSTTAPTTTTTSAPATSTTAPTTTTTSAPATSTTAPTTTTTSAPATTTTASITTTSTTAQVTTTSVSESITTNAVIPSSTVVTIPESTTLSSTSTSELSTISSETSVPIRTISTLDTTIQTTTSSTASSSSIPTLLTTDIITASQDAASIPTSESTQSVTTTPDNSAATTILQTTTITQSTRPTAVTISVVPSTIGGGNDESTTGDSTTGTTSTTQFQNTGPIVINLQPTTIASTSTTNAATESTTTTESVPTTITVPSSEAVSSESTIATADTTSTTTTSTGTTLTSNSELTAFTIDLVPSTIGTGSTPSISTSTENHIPTLVTPVGDLPDGFEIDVRPSTVTPRSADMIMTENGRNSRMVTSVPPKKKSRPRFEDDVELVKSAATHKVAERSFISDFGASKTSFPNKEKLDGNNNQLFKNMKDITIEASIGKTSSDFSTPSMPDFKANTNDEFDSLSGNSNTTELHSLMNETDFKDLDDEDIIVVNREVDFADQENVAEIVLSEEEMYSESSTEKPSILTEDDFEGKTRGTRSVIDYLIARYHDNNPTNIHMSTGAEYEPMKPTTFAVNGKIRESNINFMTYDTVLPFRYISYLNALALTFPLDSSKYYLLLILPLDEMGIDNLISNMMSTTLKQIIYHLQPTRVKATIPSFMLKGYVVLTPTLQKLGIRKIFEPRHADFSRMTDDKDIYVTNIEQAVTVTIRNYVDPSTLQNNQQFRRRGPVQFTADHPFLYFVMDSQIHVALMAGKIINPLNSRISERMIFAIFDFVRNWLYETHEVLCEADDNSLNDSEDFKPGILFCVSSCWVSVVRTLLLPDYSRKGIPACACGGPCPPAPDTSSSSSGCGSGTGSGCRCNIPPGGCRKSKDAEDACDIYIKKKKKGYSLFRC